MVVMLIISPHVQATHDPGTNHYAHSDRYFQTYAAAQAACLASLSGWPTATCGAGTGFAGCVGNRGDGFLNTKTGDQFLHCTAVCPTHSYGAPPSCICVAGYRFDAAGTSCVPEQYAISLYGLGGEVMTNQTWDAYAQVTRSDGTPASGVHVDLALTVVPEVQGQLPYAYTGYISANAVSVGSTTYSGEAGADGRLNFTFRAPEAGGTHTITATCTGCTNVATGAITVPGCPVSKLTEVSKLSELAGETPEQADLTQKLEDGMDGYSLLSPATKAAEQCLAVRVKTVVGSPSISGYKVTSTIRTYAYQKHLWEVWDKFRELKSKAANDPSIQQHCQTLISKVEGEMGLHLTQNPKKDDCTLGRAHCVRYEPATDDPKHVAKTAFDIPPMTVLKFEVALWLNEFLDSTVQKEANTCGLKWGGMFGSPDRIHFQLQ